MANWGFLGGDSAMNDENKTRQQLIEELGRLRQHVAHQRRINENLPLLITTADFGGFFQEVNAAFEDILGWPEEELLSRPFIEFIHPEDQAAAVEHFERLKAGKTPTNYVARMLCKDRSYRWISWVAISFMDQGAVFGIGKDISDQMQTMQSCRELTERYRRLTNFMPGVFET
jgi:PAS domain S-box-containing protein